MSRRPTFWGTFFRSVANSVDRRGVVALVPYWLLACLFIGGVASFSIPAEFWSNDRWDISTAVFTGVLAFNGLLLALGWGAFSKIYEILSEGSFAKFLNRNGLLNDHLFFIDFVHVALVVSSLLSGCGLFSVLVEIPLIADRITMAAVIGVTGWALIKTLSAISLMNGLIWDLAHTEDDGRGGIRVVHDAGA